MQINQRMHRIRAVGELSAGVAHDVRNALGAIALRLELVERDPQCSGLQKENLRLAGRELRDAIAMLGRLADMARGRPGRGAAQADLAAAIADAAALAGTDPQLRIDRDVPRLPAVAGSPADIKHLFLNLLLNARDAMPRGGRVRIRARRSGTTVVVTVSDEGPGIRRERLKRIFEPFYSSKGELGLGMGLAIARSVMEGLGGLISASNGRSRGAVFRLVFPASRRGARRSRS